MKTAVIYSGHVRTFKEVWPNHIWNLLRKLPKPDIYASVVDDERAEDILILDQHGFKVRLDKCTQPEIEEPPLLARWHSGYPISVPPQAVLRQLWQLNRSWNFLESFGNPDSYDLIVRVRPDVAFLRCEISASILKTGMRPAYCRTPWWEQWGGINDRFAIMGAWAAKAYFETFRVREEMFAKYCPLHPETMIAFALKLACVRNRPDLAVEFCRIREGGKPDMARMSSIDVAEFSRLPNYEIYA